ncbi:hypothetical protein [Photobacterium angustum]|uniref:hypothetical protein n=1 Tax=Photobacterium angustum TaxID=661 RepID=UPI000B1A3252|nr:hypothetical protein [Photobacterium angustum]
MAVFMLIAAWVNSGWSVSKSVNVADAEALNIRMKLQSNEYIVNRINFSYFLNDEDKGRPNKTRIIVIL